MSLPRVLLSTRSVTRVPVRGKALQNWARPSIDEIGVPTEPWVRVNDKNQKKFNLTLMTGLGVFTGTMLVVYNKIYLAGEMNNTPHHLLK